MRREKRRAKAAARRHPILRRLLLFLLVLAIAGGLGVGSGLLVHRLAPRWQQSELPAPSSPSPSLPAQSGELPEESKPLTTIPRATPDPGAALHISEKTGAALDPSGIYDAVLPSVVSVSAYISERDGYGSGSGVIMSREGYILTNYHIIEGGSEASVMLLEDNTVYPAALVGYDEELDLAVLKIEAEGLSPAIFGSSDALSVGDPAYAIGNPMGYLYGTMTDGIVSYLDRVQTVGGYEMTLIQTSAILNSGNSGGALVNRYGQVVGITVAKVSGSVDGSAMAEGIGFAIPISAVRPYIDRILATGESWKPTIGITCYAAVADGVPGIMVATVEPDTPAARAGLLPMDFITHANGVPVDSVYALKRVLGEVGVGGMLTCTLLREGACTEVTFSLIDSSDLP